MRTTLKRGIGRSTTDNGNGRMVLPPGVVESVRRYRQPPPRARSTTGLIFRALGWLVLAIAVVVSGLAGGVYLYSHETLSALAPHSAGVKKAQGDLAKLPSATEPAVALVVGYDKRAGSEGFNAADSRSDTLMLIRADPQLNTLSLLSFPRDLQAPIYCNATSSYVVDRINSAWTRCAPNGAQGALDTVQKLTGISVNYLITIDFHGFKLLVNKLHGVYMQVDHRYINTQGGPYGFATIDLHPGYQKLDGQKSLDFVRFRHTDSDLYRLARQQLFLEALKDRLATSMSLFEIPGIVGAVKHNVEIARGGEGGAPGIAEIQAYAGLATHLQGGHLFRVQIPNLVNCGFQNAEVCGTPTDIANAVASFRHPDVTLPDRANNAALGRRVKPVKQAVLKRADVSTLVLNGTTVPGLARDTSYKLAVAGYHTTQLAGQLLPNAPSSSYFSNVVYFDSVQPRAKEAAAQLQEALGPHTQVTRLTPEISVFAQQAGNPLTVSVIGTAFGGEIVDPEANVTPTPEHTAPSVRTDPGLTQGSLAGIKPHFRVMLPTVVASGSQLTSLEPVRVFKPVPGKHEVALTFVTGAGNVYWQIIQTDWTTAPILRKPTGKVRLGGRRFDLYTSGKSIHMVVLRQGKGSYWVVNTLRDELSNETMLAIAKGLRPLRQ